MKFETATERSEYITANLGLVGYFARPYFHGGHLDDEDVFQAGAIGLIQAIDAYDPVKHPGVPLSGWARQFIRREINGYIRSKRLIHIPQYFGEARMAQTPKSLKWQAKRALNKAYAEAAGQPVIRFTRGKSDEYSVAAVVDRKAMTPLDLAILHEGLARA